MKLIKELSEMIDEEIEGVAGYATKAIEVKGEYPLVAETLIAISKQEAEHVNKLHDAVSKVISDYRAKNGNPPESMLAVYNYLHEKQITKFAEAKRLQDMYVGR